MAREYKDVVVGLDIGTAKVMAVVAEVLPNGELKLAGLGVAPSNGLKRGVVVNIDATVQSIQQALKEAELMADCKIRNVYAGIAGSHIRSFNSSGMVAIKDKEVSEADMAVEEIDAFILHQANSRIIDGVAKRLKAPKEKFPRNIEAYGNTCAASIPILLDEWNRSGRAQKGQRIVLSGFGAGLIWGAAYLEW